MKKSLIILSLALLLFAPLNVQTDSSKVYINEQLYEPETQSWEETGNMIREALAYFERSEPSKGTALLIDAALLYDPDITFEKGIEAKLLSAKKHFLNNDYPKAGKLVAQVLALETIKQVSRIESIKPSELSVTIADKVKDLLVKAIKEFWMGNPARGVVAILESLVLLT